MTTFTFGLATQGLAMSALPQIRPEPDIEAVLADIGAHLGDYRQRGLRMFATSSFGSGSAVLLHILSRLAPEVPIYFLDTGYHFAETLAYRRQLSALLGLEVRDLSSPVAHALQHDPDGRPLHASDPDRCCHLNKVAPLEDVLPHHDVWINGVRGAQSAVRRAMSPEEPAPHGVLRYHPLIDWTSRMMWDYRKHFSLPPHPLERLGYPSIGCEPCTRPADSADERDGRWAGKAKTECGLHTALAGRR